MRFEKRRLADARQGYAVASLRLCGDQRIIAASEGAGPVVVFEGRELQRRVLLQGPGGCMGFAEVPGRDDAFFMITRFYPIFRAENAGVDLVRRSPRERWAWEGGRAIDLPFVHRVASVSTSEGDYLVAATVCGGKEHRDDWSRPGAVYAFEIDRALDRALTPVVVLEAVHRNHGLCLGMLDGRKALLVSGDEGVVALEVEGAPDGARSDPWRVSVIIDHPVSEVVLFDLDDDGEDELVTVEPFHGNEMSVYKRLGGAWKKIFSAELAFGHGLSAGRLGGEPAVIVGNRDGSKDLLCFRSDTQAPRFAMERIVVDHGSGTAGTIFLDAPPGGVVASNAELREYAIYLPQE